MITKEQIEFTAKQEVLSLIDKDFGEVDAQNIGVGFRNGAAWAVEQLDPLCASAAEMIEKLQAENARLREIVNTAQRYAIDGSHNNETCRIIARKIQAALAQQ